MYIPPPMLSGSTLCFHSVEQIIPRRKSYFTAGRDGRFRTAWCEWNGRRASGRASTKHIGQPTANKARGRTDGRMEVRYASISRSERHVTSAVSWWHDFPIRRDRTIHSCAQDVILWSVSLRADLLPSSVEFVEDDYRSVIWKSKGKKKNSAGSFSPFSAIIGTKLTKIVVKSHANKAISGEICIHLELVCNGRILSL